MRCALISGENWAHALYELDPTNITNWAHALYWYTGACPVLICTVRSAAVRSCAELANHALVRAVEHRFGGKGQ